MKTYKHKSNGSTMTYKDGCMRIENLVVEGHPNLEYWEEVVEDNNPLKLELGKTYKIRYKFCTSPIKICKVDRFTQHGYPWSNSLGGIITDSYELIEEVVEKDYEILSFYCNDKIFSKLHPKSSKSFPYWSKDTTWVSYDNRYCKIHSVKRISDGQIFTIGDKCNPIGEYSNNRGTIDKIEFCEAGYLRLASKNWYMNIDGIEHSRKPLFTTEDGVDIYKGDSYCKVNNHSNYSMVTGFVAEGAHDNYKGLKFSTKESAEEYILYNKPRFSLKDVFSVYPEFKKCEKERTKHAEELIHIARKNEIL